MRGEELERLQIVLFIRRIEKDDVPRPGFRLPQKLARLRTVNLVLLFRNSAQLQIRFDQLATTPRTIDKRRIARTTRKRLDPYRARSCAQIEKSRILDTRRDHVEECFAKPIRRR